MAKPKKKSTAKWTKGRKLAVKKCARGSPFFSRKQGAAKLFTFCCPVGRWHPRRKKNKCEGGLKKHLLRVPKKR